MVETIIAYIFLSILFTLFVAFIFSLVRLPNHIYEYGLLLLLFYFVGVVFLYAFHIIYIIHIHNTQIHIISILN